MRSLNGISLISLLWSLPVVLHAEDDPQPVKVYVEVERRCADVALGGIFVDELRLRMPEVTVVLGENPTGDDVWRLQWAQSESDEGCAITAMWGATSRMLPISFSPDPGQVELAASQMAWMMSLDPDTPTSTMPAASPPQESDRAVDESDGSTLQPDDLPPKEMTTKPEGGDTGDGVEALEAPTSSPGQRTPPAPLGSDAEGVKATEVAFRFSALPNTDLQRQRVVPRLSLNLIAGEHWGLRGFEFGVVANSQVRFVEGVQVVGGFNRVGGDVKGAQIAVLSNSAGRKAEGAQLAVGINRATRLVGLQWAWGVNDADHAQGGQLAWLANLVGHIQGVQLAGAVNFADRVSGIQLGLLNIADRVDGAQLGLVNFANTATAPVGLVNIVASEPVYAVASIGAGGITAVGLQHGGRNLRCLYLVAADVIGDQPGGEWGAYGLGFGLSGHLPFEFSYLDLDLLAFRLWIDGESGASHQLSLRGLFGWRLRERLAFFAGPSVNLLLTDRSDGLGIVPFGIETIPSRPGAEITLLYPELHAGVRF